MNLHDIPREVTAGIPPREILEAYAGLLTQHPGYDKLKWEPTDIKLKWEPTGMGAAYIQYGADTAWLYFAYQYWYDEYRHLVSDMDGAVERILRVNLVPYEST
jgi:hypothetical protein